MEASAGCPAPLQKGMTDAMLEPLMKLFPKQACCYDGKKNVYAPGILTPDMLTDEARAAHWSVEADESLPGGALWKLLFHGPNKPDSVVTMKAVGEGLNLGRLWGDKGPANLMSMADDAELGAEFRKYMASIDILLQPVRMYKPLKNAYFNENRDANWGYMKQLGRESNQQLWLGYRQTVVDTLDGPMLFIDTAAAAMHAPCDLLSFIATKMKLRHRSEVTKQHVFDARRQLTTMIGGQKPKIVSSHSNREYKLADIDDKPANESTFFDEDAGRERTIADYFTEKGHRLNFPGLPCVCVGKRTDPSKIRIPIELCKLVGGEPMQITPVIQAEMIKETAMEPELRFKEIKKVIADKATGPGVQACAAPAFGVSTGAELVEIEQARVLDSPRLMCVASVIRPHRHPRPHRARHSTTAPRPPPRPPLTRTSSSVPATQLQEPPAWGVGGGGAGRPEEGRLERNAGRPGPRLFRPRRAAARVGGAPRATRHGPWHSVAWPLPWARPSRV